MRSKILTKPEGKNAQSQWPFYLAQREIWKMYYFIGIIIKKGIISVSNYEITSHVLRSCLHLLTSPYSTELGSTLFYFILEISKEKIILKFEMWGIAPPKYDKEWYNHCCLLTIHSFLSRRFKTWNITSVTLHFPQSLAFIYFVFPKQGYYQTDFSFCSIDLRYEKFHF